MGVSLGGICLCHNKMDADRWPMCDDSSMNESGGAAQWERKMWGYCSGEVMEKMRSSVVV